MQQNAGNFMNLLNILLGIITCVIVPFHAVMKRKKPLLIYVSLLIIGLCVTGRLVYQYIR